MVSEMELIGQAESDFDLEEIEDEDSGTDEDDNDDDDDDDDEDDESGDYENVTTSMLYLFSHPPEALLVCHNIFSCLNIIGMGFTSRRRGGCRGSW